MSAAGSVPGKGELAGGGFDDLRSDAEERGFAGTVAARKRDTFAGSDFEGDSAEGVETAVAFIDFLEAQAGWWWRGGVQFVHRLNGAVQCCHPTAGAKAPSSCFGRCRSLTAAGSSDPLKEKSQRIDKGKNKDKSNDRVKLTGLKTGHNINQKPDQEKPKMVTLQRGVDATKNKPRSAARNGLAT